MALEQDINPIESKTEKIIVIIQKTWLLSFDDLMSPIKLYAGRNATQI